MSRAAFLADVLRLVGAGAALAAASAEPLIAAPVGAALFLAAFGFNHDALHGALSLSRRGRDLALFCAGSAMLMSGHAIRVMHLLHHRRPMSDADLEGAAAKVSLPGAVLESPSLSLRYRLAGWRLASAKERRWQLAEYAADLALAVALLASGLPGLQLYAVIALLFQVFMPAWAGHIPHRAPAWLLGLARRLARSRSLVVLSLAYHEAHHRHPAVPCRDLAQLAADEAQNSPAIGRSQAA